MKIGFALGSGGLRGAAHIGVLQVLEEAGIKPDIVAGTSSGSLVAALLASGMSPKEMEKLAKRLKASDIVESTAGSAVTFVGPAILKLLGFKTNLRSGLLPGKKLEKFVMCQVGNIKMSDLKLPCAAIAVDVNTGAKIVFNSMKMRHFKATLCYDAYVKDAVRASCSIPGVFTWKAWQGRCLVDGAMREPVPARTLKEMGADFVIGVDLGRSGECDRKAKNIIDNVSRSIDIMSEEVSEYILSSYSDIVINPGIFSASLTEVEQIPKFIQAGRKAAQDALPSIMAALRRSNMYVLNSV